MSDLLKNIQKFIAPEIESIKSDVKNLADRYKELRKEMSDIRERHVEFRERVSSMEGRYKNISSDVYRKVENKILKDKISKALLNQNPNNNLKLDE